MKRLAEISWKEAQAARDAGALVLVPVGSTEAHGPHLPLSTDVIISEELCVRAGLQLEAAGAKVLIAPPLAYSVTDYAGEFTGTVTIPKETAIALVRDVCLALQRQGFERVVLVNSHLEPAHLETLRAASAAVESASGKKVAFPDACSKRWARTLTDEFKSGACHAGRYETSLVLATRPELVGDGARATLPPLAVDLAKAMKAGVKTFKEAGAADAYFGDPAAATAAHGDEIYSLLVTMVRTEIAETWP